MNVDALRTHVRKLWEEAFPLDPWDCEEIARVALEPVGKIDVPSGVFCWGRLSVRDLQRMGPPLFAICLEGRG